MGSAVQTKSERRAEPRMLCSELLPVHWEAPQGNRCTATALLENISRSGCLLQLGVPIRQSTHLSLAAPGIELRGSALHCQFLDDAYFIGVQFDADCEWSVERYRPQHLLDPRTLDPTPI